MQKGQAAGEHVQCYLQGQDLHKLLAVKHAPRPQLPEKETLFGCHWDRGLWQAAPSRAPQRRLQDLPAVEERGRRLTRGVWPRTVYITHQHSSGIYQHTTWFNKQHIIISAVSP